MAKRLQSLDILRGADIFLLVVAGPFFGALNGAFGLPSGVMAQFRHAWGGFSLWDMIMPLFIFMSGASVPLALPRRMHDGRAGREYALHVLSRFALLWVLGMVAQGRLLTMDPLLISPFNNTLQSIACGYVACAVLFLFGRRTRLCTIAALVAGYSLFLHFGGDYTVEGTAAMKVERWLVPLITPDGSLALAKADPGYTWWATVPMFAAMGLCGMEATILLKQESPSPGRKALLLAGCGAALIVAGFAFSPIIPSIKHIFTATFTAKAIGISLILLGGLYWISDVKFAASERFAKSMWIFRLFGRASLLAYMCHGAFRPVFRAFGGIFAPGVAHLFGEEWKGVASWLAASLLLIAVLRLRLAARRVCQ